MGKNLVDTTLLNISLHFALKRKSENWDITSRYVTFNVFQQQVEALNTAPFFSSQC
jgi:hypothetical protein